MRASARRVETVPSEREVEEHNLDHGVFRSWCPHCVKRRAEACGHVRNAIGESDAMTVGVDYMHTQSEQEKEEERGMPIAAVKGNKMKMITAKVVPRKGSRTMRGRSRREWWSVQVTGRLS